MRKIDENLKAFLAEKAREEYEEWINQGHEEISNEEEILNFPKIPSRLSPGEAERLHWEHEESREEEE